MTVVTRNNRSDRIGAFVDEVRRCIYNDCMNNKVSVGSIDCFCHDMFVLMNKDKSEYEFVELLRMLQNDVFLKEVYLRYRKASR